LECNAGRKKLKKKEREKNGKGTGHDFRLQLALNGLVIRDYNADTSGKKIIWMVI
jgi:hypothetical protein